MVGSKRRGKPELTFHVVGTPGEDSLVVYTDLIAGKVTLSLPVEALPWRDLAHVERHGRRLPRGVGIRPDPLARAARTRLRRDAVLGKTDIVGAKRLELALGFVSFTSHQVKPVQTTPGKRREPTVALLVPHVRLVNGERMPVRLRVRGVRRGSEKQCVHVAQFSDGRRVGGVTLELR